MSQQKRKVYDYDDKTGSTGTTNKKRHAAEKVQPCDFFIVSNNKQWEKKLAGDIKEKAPQVKCLTTENFTLGEFKSTAFLRLLEQCKLIVVGFSEEETTDLLDFIAVWTLKDSVKNKTLRKLKFVSVKLSDNAKIPTEAEIYVEVNGWEDGLVDRLLDALEAAGMDSEEEGEPGTSNQGQSQERKQSNRRFGTTVVRGKNKTEVPVQILDSELTMTDDGAWEFRKKSGKTEMVQISSTPITTENGMNQLMQLKNENIECFRYLTRKQGPLNAVYSSNPDYRTLRNCNPEFLKSKYQKQQTVVGVTNGLVFLHKNKIKHGNLNMSTVIVNSSGQAKLRDFGFANTSVPESADWMGWLTYFSPDIDELAAVSWNILTQTEIKRDRKTYNISGYGNTSRFFIACFDVPERRPPALEALYWFHAIFAMPSPTIGNGDQECLDRYRLKKKRGLKCQGCNKQIKMELVMTHREEYKTRNGYNVERDVHYCSTVKCIGKKNPTFNGHVIYDSAFRAIITIEDIVKLKSSHFQYHNY